MESSLPSVLSADEQSTLEAIAVELQNPGLASDRRADLLRVIKEIADRYACDPRMTDD